MVTQSAVSPRQSTESPRRRTSGSSLSQACQVAPWLYISGAWAVKARRLKELAVTCVVNATVELPELRLDGVEVVVVRICDSAAVDLRHVLHDAADKLEEVRKGGGVALVHCVAGVSRSASIVLAYLVKYTGLSLRQAFHLLRKARPVVRPNNGFFAQLIEFERQVRGTTSVEIVKVSDKGLFIPDVFEEEMKVLCNQQWIDVIMERRNFENQYRPVTISCV